MIQFNDILTSKIDDKEDLIKLGEEAKTYLLNHKWCNGINSWLDRGWADKVGVFYFEIDPLDENVDKFVWIITGDLPSAYIDIISAKNGAMALKIYTELMQEWVDCVSNNKSIENCYPINVPPEKKFANMLQIRINLINEEILPYYTDELHD
jgi:hypothetical protein